MAVAGQAAGNVCSTLSAREGEGRRLVTGEGDSQVEEGREPVTRTSPARCVFACLRL